MGYYINLESISTDNYREIIKSADLTKSRLILKENTDEIFEIIKKQGINNVDELQKTLKSKDKLKAFAKKSGIDKEYLTILIREINSSIQKPNKIKDFPEIPENIVSKLEDLNIKNTLQLYEKVVTAKTRLELSKESKIGQEDILKLTKLTDLSRIRWVNHTFAFVLHEAGFDTTEKVANANYNELYSMIKQLNDKRNLYKGHIGLNDMKLTVNAAKDVPLDIEY